MKYTKEQAKQLKNKEMDGYTKYTIYKSWNPLITKKGKYYIVESKMNNPYLK